MTPPLFDGAGFNATERKFMKTVGIDPNDLDGLVANAPVLSPAMQARLQQRTWDKLEKLGVTPLAPAKPGRGPAGWAGWATRRRLAVAAAVIAIGASLVVAGPSVYGALQRVAQFVPGIGITETNEQTLVMSEPVTVTGRRGSLTITAMLVTPEHAELRFTIDSVDIVKPDPRSLGQAPLQAALVMADGTRVEQSSVISTAGENSITGTVWFPPFPAPVDSVTLELSSLLGGDSFSAQIPLVAAADAGLAEAVSGPWSDLHNGVEVRVPQMVHTGDRIVLTLEGSVAGRKARIEALGPALSTSAWPGDLILVDDLGHSYPLLTAESELYIAGTQPLTAVFQGPVQPEAKALRLIIEGIQMQEEGEARLRLPLRRLTIGEEIPVGETLLVGNWPVVLRSITRVTESRFLLDVDLGSWRDGAVLQYISILPYRTSGGGFFTWDGGQATNFGVEYLPKNGYLDLALREPTVYVEGPWLIDLPLRDGA